MEKKVAFCESKMAVVDRVLAEKAKDMNKEIRIIKVPGTENVADALTKHITNAEVD